MRYPKNIDLHIHTRISDGTDSPEDILTKVKAAGIEVFSVTDHDAVKGCLTVQSIRRESDPLFLTGVEFSCRDEEGFYHILAYGYDPDAVSMQELAEFGHTIRMKKLRMRLDHLESEFGFSFSETETEELMAMNNPGKPHLAILMVKKGYAKTKEDAIESYLNKLHVRSAFLRPEDAITGILAGGGIPVLAHPSYGNGDQLILGDEMNQRLRHLTAFGLRGVEAYYSGFTPKIRNEMLQFAEQYDLYVTAGSDYHGNNKSVELGDTGLDTCPEVPERMCRFLKDVGIPPLP